MRFSSKITKSNFLLILLLPFFFTFSLFLMNLYIFGDQELYIKVYENLKNVKFSEIVLGNSPYYYVNVFEKLSMTVLWLGAQIGLSKNIYISLLNMTLLSGIYLLASKYKAPWYVMILLLSNFYVIVLLTGAERLKIAYILIIYSTLIPGKLGLLSAILSPLAHLQSFIILCSLAFIKFGNEIKSSLIFKKKFFYLILTFLFSIILLFYFTRETIFEKVSLYLIHKNFNGTLKIIAILLVGMLITRHRLRMIICLFPQIIAAYFLGEIRINMIAVSIFIYLLLIERKLNNPFSLIILLYLSIKSIPFLKNIYFTGDGFNGWLF